MRIINTFIFLGTLIGMIAELYIGSRVQNRDKEKILTALDKDAKILFTIKNLDGSINFLKWWILLFFGSLIYVLIERWIFNGLSTIKDIPYLIGGTFGIVFFGCLFAGFAKLISLIGKIPFSYNQFMKIVSLGIIANILYQIVNFGK